MTDPEFQYVALAPNGTKTRGRVRAISLKRAAALVRSQGLSPISISPSRVGATSRQTLAPDRLAELLHSLSLLVGSGTTVSAALALARPATSQPALNGLLNRIDRDVAGGMPVSDAFGQALGERYNFVSALLAAGEASGDLSGAFGKASHQLQRDAMAAEELWAAISYPLFVLSASLLAIGVLLTIVVPALAPLVAETQISGPNMLAVLVHVSTALHRHGLALASGLGLAVTCLIVAQLLGVLDKYNETLLLDGPARSLVRSLTYGRFASMLGSLFSADIPAAQAFQLATASVGLAVAKQRLVQCSKRLFEGEPISEVLAACKGMPLMIVRMAQVGEQSGSLGGMLERGGDIEQQLALRHLRAISKWIGPMMIAVLGAMIGLVMASLLTGIANIGDSVLK